MTKRDSVFYLVRDGREDKRFYNGNLVSSTTYDEHNNILKEINYLVSGIVVTEEFLHQYDKYGKIQDETFVYNTDTVYRMKYTYRDSLLVEKYYAQNKCCERNQPIPPDKILYEYDNKKNLIKEMEVTDRSIRRIYKHESSVYYNNVVITTYSYDNQNRLSGKKIYVPNFSDDRNTPIEKLYVTPSFLSGEYIYKYKSILLGLAQGV